MTVRVITLFFLVFLSIAASPDSLTGKVVKITDGDTLYVLDANYQQHKIRLAGIDAPERKQAYGLASRKHLASIVAGQLVTVEYRKRDRYGGIVGKVLVNSIDACLEQVKAGFAARGASGLRRLSAFSTSCRNRPSTHPASAMYTCTGRGLNY